ncbi:MAG: hypothetical protein K0Q55_2620 [Verrucomicrobia bacterium]|jgi:hypothetical protein|nr:hypothetical protein [Verrucomicrobiota bacterium]
MPKYLRYLAGFHDVEIEQALGRAGVVHLLPMYEYYCLPLPVEGCAKLIISFRLQPTQTAPSLVLDIATIERPFDLAQFTSLPAADQPRYALDALHSAFTTAGHHFHWPLARAQEAYDRIVREKFQFHFVRAKPKASPDRKLRAQVEVDFANTVRLTVVFLKPDGEVHLRQPLSLLSPGMGVVNYVLDKLAWISPTTLQITHGNGRDYWLCGTDGFLRFIYPRAERGDPHGLYDLGRMYLAGQYVLRDPAQGRKLIEEAARKGWPPAREYLRRTAADESL